MRVAIIGGYGAIGAVVARELHQHTDAELVLAGRDLSRASDAAASFGQRVSGRRTDLFAPESLAELCRDSDLIVNCAGPSHHVRDRVVRAATAAGRHFVDAGGAEATFPALTATWHDPEQAGLVAIVDAGWIPGLSGVLTHLLAKRAREQFERVQRIELWFGDRSAWSHTAVIDILELVRMRPGLGEYRDGQFIERPKGALRRVRLPNPFGSRIATLSFTSELTGLARRETGTNVASWAVPMMRPSTAAATVTALTALASRPNAGARLLGAAMQRNPRAHDGGFLAARATGLSDGKPVRMRAYLAARDTEQLTGRLCATTARLIVEARISARGCRYLCDAVDPELLLTEVDLLDQVQWAFQ